MTRAATLLERDTQTFLPYNFLHESEFICEGINPETAKHDLDLIIGKGKHAYLGLKQGLREDIQKYKERLMLETSSHPAIQTSLEQDVGQMTSRATSLAKKFFKSRLQKKDKNIIQEELIFLFQEIEEGTIRLSSFQALNSIQLPQGIFRKVRDIIIAILGFSFISALNTAVLVALVPTFGLNIAMIICVCFCAPIIEELYKVVTVRVLKSPMPTYVTFIFEFISYTGKIIGLAASNMTGTSVILFILVGIIGRFYALEMHMQTTQSYMKDVSLLGKIRMKTIFSGIVLHMIWNVVATLVQGLLGIASVLSMALGIVLHVGLSQSLYNIFSKALQGKPHNHDTFKPHYIPNY